MRFRALEKLHRMHDGYRNAITLEGRNLLLFQHNGQIHIIDNNCPHAGARLDKSSISGNELRCPWHGIAFNIHSGDAVTCGLKLVKYEPVYEQQSVGIVI
jgi:3-phenylpropionate/trans-cinnamate dioxygenase ferredoxin subunit